MSELPKKELPINTVEYPFEYFDAQVQFARKWAQVTGTPLADALLRNTALYRRLTDKKLSGETNLLWKETIAEVEASDPTSVSHLIYDTYLNQPHSEYMPPYHSLNNGNHFGFVAYDYYPNNPVNGGKNTVKVHFVNGQRGKKSPLHQDFAAQRKLDVKRMFEFIKSVHPDAEETIGGSWLYNLPAYRDSFPSGYTANMQRLVPPGFENEYPDAVPNMAFTGDSVWGQFVDRYGWGRSAVYTEFMHNISKAASARELVDAFPNRPMQPKAAVSVFYNWQP